MGVESPKPVSTATGAVFLSYASEDAEAARRICEALRTAGIEVWFDRQQLRGGDAWNQKIARQIRECALFLAIVSAHTEQRPEGFFRREWFLAVDRTREMADDHAYLIPVAIDSTDENTARVPDRFRDFQWIRLPKGEGSPQFVSRIARLLAGNPTDATSRASPRVRRGAYPDRATAGSLLHLMWDQLDANLQDAFALAYNKKRRAGSTRISTRDLFQALIRVQDGELMRLLQSLPAGALPEAVDSSIVASRELLQETPLLSDCVAESLTGFHNLGSLGRKLSPADIFVDIAIHGHGPSVERLRQHGVSAAQVAQRAEDLGIAHIEHARPEVTRS
jgi:hypothetical protein